MSETKKQNLFAKLAAQQLKPEAEAAPASPVAAAEEMAAPPSPAPPALTRPKLLAAKKPQPTRGKRDNPDYCQANAYIPREMRRQVEIALLSIDGLDYSSLVEDLLRKWLKSRSVPG